MRQVVAILLVLALAGCADRDQVPSTTTPAVIAKPVTKPLDLKRICSQVKTYSDAESRALTTAVVALDAMSILIVAMADYARMRAEARACQANG